MCWNKGRLYWKIAKLFYFCHLKKLVRPETFGPTLVLACGTMCSWKSSACYILLVIQLEKGKAFWVLKTVKPVKLTSFIRWPPTDVDHVSVEAAKSYVVCINNHLRNFSAFICWIPVYVSHVKWNRGTVYTCLYWPWQYFRPVKWSRSLLCLVSLDSFFVLESYGCSPSSMYRDWWKVLYETRLRDK